LVAVSRAVLPAVVQRERTSPSPNSIGAVGLVIGAA